MSLDKKQYRVSRWCHFYNRPEVVAAHHSLSLESIFLPPVVGRQLQNLKKTSANFVAGDYGINTELLSVLLEYDLVLPVGYDEMKDLYELRDQLQDQITLEMMYLILTDKCNLRCRYCFEESGGSSECEESLMSAETASRALATFARLSEKYGEPEKEKIVHLYGGEPLVNWPVLRHFVEEMDGYREKFPHLADCKLVIITNGVLLDAEQARFLAEHGVDAGVSIDGPPDLNNLYRISRTGNVDVYQAARRAYQLLRQYGVHVGISSALTPEVTANLDDVVNFFLKEFPDFDGISLNILHYNPMVPVEPEYYQEAAEGLIRAFQRLRDLNVYEEIMMRKAGDFAKRERAYSDCGVVGRQIVVAPDGRIGVCQDFVKPRTYFGGSVYDPVYDPYQAGLFDGWRERSPLFMPECFDCPALGFCGGGCPASIELKTGSRWNIDDRICPHSQLSLEWLIWDMYDRMP